MKRSVAKEDITNILFKALSVYAFLRALDVFSNKFHFLFNIISDDPRNAILIGVQVIVPPILLILGGLLLWYLGPFLASNICRSMELDQTLSLSSRDIQVIAFSAIGLFIIANALPDFVQTLVIHYGIDAFSTANRPTIVRRNALLFGLLARTVVGVWLLLGSRRIVKLMFPLRRDNGEVKGDALK